MDGHTGETLTDSTNYRYDMSPDEMSQQVSRLLETRPPKNSDKLVYYRVDGEMANVARSVECDVFEEAFGNDAEAMADIYGKYEEASRFFLAIDTENKRPCGTLRIIENSPAGLMTFNDLPAESSSLTTQEMMDAHGIESPDDCWDVGTVAVYRQYRQDKRSIVAQRLYRSMYVSALKENVKHLTSIIDDRPYKKMTETIGIPFKPLAGTEPFAFEGSNLSHAVHGYVPEFYKKMSRPDRNLGSYVVRLAVARGLIFGKGFGKTKDSDLML